MGPASESSGPIDEDAIEWAVTGLVPTDLGGPTPSGLWFRVSVPSRR